MNNPHSYAWEIETILRNHGLASYQDANEIQEDPIEFIVNVLLVYRRNHTNKVAIVSGFIAEYDEKKGTAICNMDESYIEKLISDLREIFL